MIELQHVTRRIEVRDGVVAETRIEREGVLAASDRPYVARRCDNLVLPPLQRVIVSWLLPLAVTESPAPLPRVIAS